MYSTFTAQEEIAIIKAIGVQRFKTYLSEVKTILGTTESPEILEEMEYALELYEWRAELAGLLQRRIAYFEVILRNKIDEQLRVWNSNQVGEREIERYDQRLGRNVEIKEEVSYTSSWSMKGNTAAPLFEILPPKYLQEILDSAKQAKRDRDIRHPRKNAPIVHDDMLSQMSFSTWYKIIGNRGDTLDSKRQILWEDALCCAFPYAPNVKSHQTRREIGFLIKDIRRLRNRVSHHDSLRYENIKQRLDDIKTLTKYINPDLITFVDNKEIYRFMNDKEAPLTKLRKIKKSV